jgi:O-antigen/teichoic acid export membrane protein
MNRPLTKRTELSPSDLKQAAVSGVRWTMVARVASELIALVSAVVLARLVAPSEFGEAVVPLIFVPLAVIFTFEGLGSALVQRKEIDQAHIEAAMLASLVTGAALSAATFLLAGPVGGQLFGKASAELLRLISPVFLLAGLGAVSRGLLWRHLDFRRVSLIEMISLALGAASAVAMALAGLAAEAIVLGALIATLTTAVLLLVSVPPPMPRFHREALRDVTGFGLPASAAGLTYVAVSNATVAVAAVRLSAAQVGLYWRAFQLGVSYQDKISGIMMRLAFPIYSRTSDIDELRRFHERATRIHAAVLLPLLSLLIVLAPDLVPWVFGERWAPAAGPVQILAVAGMIAAILTGYPQILLAAGKPRALLIFNVVLLALYAASSWIAAPYGITALAISVVVVHIAMIVAVYGVLFRLLLRIPIGRLVSDLLPAIACSLALFAAGVPLAGLLRDAGAPVPALAALVGLAGTAVYASALRSFFPVVWNDIVQLTARVLPDGARTVRFRRLAMRSVGGEA